MLGAEKNREKHITGAFTFVSQDVFIDQLIEAYLEMRQLPEDAEYKLYVQLNFLDSVAKSLLFNYLTLLASVSKRKNFPNLKIHFLYNWQDEDMEELGLFLAEQLVDTIHLCQIDEDDQKPMRVA